VGTKIIYLPAIPLRVSLRAYIDAIYLAKSSPDIEFKHGLTTWWPTTGKEIRKQFLAGIHDRINSKSLPQSTTT
jgi:hypothetical protein